MTKLHMTVPLEVWCDVYEHAGVARWRVVGDDGYVREGRLTHRPAVDPCDLTPGQPIYISGADDELVGDPILVGSVRSIVRIR